MADHNDPNSVNSIFSDVGLSAADVYDMFGYPSDAEDQEQVVLALTFAPVPDTGMFDTDVLYRLQINPHARPGRPAEEDRSLAAGSPADAVDGYRQVLAEVDRPEFREGLGTALAATGRDDEAAACHASARATYLASVARGEVHHLHHLAACLADVDPAAAVVWADRDVGSRRSGPTLSLLGWCLFRAGRVDEARTAVAEALALGAGDPRLRERARAVGFDSGKQADVLIPREGRLR